MLPVASPPARTINLGMPGHQGLATVCAPESRPILILYLTPLDARSPDRIVHRPPQSLSSQSRRISHLQPLNHISLPRAPHTPAAVIMRTKDQRSRLPPSHMTIPSQTVQRRAETSFPVHQQHRLATHRSLCLTQMAPTVYITMTCPMVMRWQTTGLVRHRTDSWRDQACLLRVTLSR